MGRKLGGLIVAALLAGCATSHIMVGAQRAPISVDQVRVYLQPPAQYETIAMLESSSQGALAFTSQQKTDKVLARLKAEAAKLGANGILLQGINSQVAGMVTNGFGQANGYSYGNSAYAYGSGVSISAPIMQKVGSAVAIYVTDSSPAQATVPAAPINAPAPPTTQPYEPDPSKRCDACQRIGDHL